MILELFTQPVLPQNPSMTRDQISKIRGLLQDLLTGEWEELVETMLKNIKGGVFTTDLMTLYNILADRGKLFAAREGAPWGGLGGGNVPDNTAELVINFRWSSLQWVALEELTHANGPTGVPSIDHAMMAQAAIQAAQSLGVSLDKLSRR